MSEQSAFPSVDYRNNEVYDSQNGMTLRDYFAAKAMNGILACTTVREINLDDIAGNAFKMADAMMIARNKK